MQVSLWSKSLETYLRATVDGNYTRAAGKRVKNHCLRCALIQNASLRGAFLNGARAIEVGH